MPPRSIDTSPLGLQREIGRLWDAIAARPVAPVTVNTGATATMTDRQPRWIVVTKTKDDFPGASSTVRASLGTFPAGTLFTHVRINPTATFTTTLGSNVDAQVPTPTNGAHYDGTIKTVSLSTPSPLQDQAASIFMTGDPAAPFDFELEITIGGGETGNDLTAGVVEIHLLVSIPNATTDALPHE